MKEFIKQQHEIIDKKLEELKDIIINRDESNFKASEILEELIFYYDVHFYSENKLVDKFLDVKDAENHKKAHSEFYKSLVELRNMDFISIDIYKKLKDWSNKLYDYMEIK